ncbi:MAG: phosphoribosylanthranilate isomerase [Promethearchaeota archaeon]
MVNVKICGVKDIQIARYSKHCGASFIGLVVGTPSSPRNLEFTKATRILKDIQEEVNTVLVTREANFNIFNLAKKTNVNYLQLHWPMNKAIVQRERVHFKGNLIIGIKPSITAKELGDIEDMLKNGDIILIDNSMGTGISVPKSILRAVLKRLDSILGLEIEDVFLGGGFTSRNIEKYLQEFRPKGIDVSSGVEIYPGVKNKKLIQEFCNKIINILEVS